MPSLSPPRQALEDATTDGALTAVVFDLDGTLYHQPPMRRRMLRELALAPLRGPGRAWREARALSQFRRTREALRELGRPTESLDELQYARPAAELGTDPAALRTTVERWMHERPLKHLPSCARVGLAAGLERLRAKGLQLGVFSDYPVEAKLEALEVRQFFEVCLAATDNDVNAFKPHPRGFELAAERLGAKPQDVLYVGDRADVDAQGAQAAGLRAALIGDDTAPGVPSYASFQELVDDLVR